MSIFDKLFSKAADAAADAVKTAASNIGNKKEEFTFAALPESLDELKSLPEAKLDDPYKAAALTVVALCVYAADKNIGKEMLEVAQQKLFDYKRFFSETEPSKELTDEEMDLLIAFVLELGMDEKMAEKMTEKMAGQWIEYKMMLLKTMGR